MRGGYLWALRLTQPCPRELCCVLACGGAQGCMDLLAGQTVQLPCARAAAHTLWHSLRTVQGCLTRGHVSHSCLAFLL